MAKGITGSDLRDKSDADLLELTKSTTTELFTARFENHTNRLNDTAKIRKLRRQIARVKTVIAEKAHKAAGGAKKSEG